MKECFTFKQNVYGVKLIKGFDKKLSIMELKRFCRDNNYDEDKVFQMHSNVDGWGLFHKKEINPKGWVDRVRPVLPD